MLGANPPIGETDREEDEPDDVRRPGAASVGLVAGEHDPDHRAEEEGAGDPAVPGDATEVGFDLGQDRGDGERLERDQGDDRDEPDLQRSAAVDVRHVMHRRSSAAVARRCVRGSPRSVARFATGPTAPTGIIGLNVLVWQRVFRIDEHRYVL